MVRKRRSPLAEAQWPISAYVSAYVSAITQCTMRLTLEGRPQLSEPGRSIRVQNICLEKGGRLCSKTTFTTTVDRVMTAPTTFWPTPQTESHLRQARSNGVAPRRSDSLNGPTRRKYICYTCFRRHHASGLQKRSTSRHQ